MAPALEDAALTWKKSAGHPMLNIGPGNPVSIASFVGDVRGSAAVPHVARDGTGNGLNTDDLTLCEGHADLT